MLSHACGWVFLGLGSGWRCCSRWVSLDRAVGGVRWCVVLCVCYGRTAVAPPSRLWTLKRVRYVVHVTTSHGRDRCPHPRTFPRVPLRSRPPPLAGTANFICEIPKWTRRKMEVATRELFNPIKQVPLPLPLPLLLPLPPLQLRSRCSCQSCFQCFEVLSTLLTVLLRASPSACVLVPPLPDFLPRTPPTVACANTTGATCCGACPVTCVVMPRWCPAVRACHLCRLAALVPRRACLSPVPSCRVGAPPVVYRAVGAVPSWSALPTPPPTPPAALVPGFFLLFACFGFGPGRNYGAFPMVRARPSHASPVRLCPCRVAPCLPLPPLSRSRRVDPLVVAWLCFSSLSADMGGPRARVPGHGYVSCLAPSARPLKPPHPHPLCTRKSPPRDVAAACTKKSVFVDP